MPPEKRANFTLESIKKLRPKDRPYEVRDGKLTGLLVRVQPNGKKYYYFEFDLPRTPTGKRKRARFNIGDANEAMPPEVARAKSIAILAEQNSGAEPAEKRRPSPSSCYKEFLNQTYRPWLQSHLAHGDYAYETLMKAFGEFHDLALVEITPAVIENWRTRKLNEINQRTGRRPNPNTINRQLSDLKACLHRARDIWDVPISEKLDKVKPCKIDRSPKVRFLSRAEENRLRSALDDREQELRDGKLAYALRKRGKFAYSKAAELAIRTFADHLKPAVLLSLNTGLRQGELLKLKWDDIDFDNAVLTVVGTTSKTGKTRHVNLNSEALAVLRAWRNQPGNKSISGYVFASIDGEPFQDMRTSWEGVLRRAKITKFRWHDLRHTFASNLVMAGENLNTVRELLGHADYKMTLRYAHLAPEHKAAAVAKLCDYRSGHL